MSDLSDFLIDGLPGWIGWRPENADRIYTLGPHGDPTADASFYTGTTPDGLQRIMGPWDGQLNVCLAFHSDGSVAGLQTRAVPPCPPDEAATLSRWDLDFGWGLRQARLWQAELHWQPGPIHVRRFMVAENPIYISDYPRWALRYLTDPMFCYFPDEREEVHQNVLEWEESGSFVFWWRKDYYISRDGEVLAT